MTSDDFKTWRASLKKTQWEMAIFLDRQVRTIQLYESGKLSIPSWVDRIKAAKC